MRQLNQLLTLALLLTLGAYHIDSAVAQSDPIPTIIVNTPLDDPRGCPERCTLRSAIIIADPGDVIGFDPAASGVLVLAQPLVIDKDLTIVGPGSDVFAIDGSKQFRALEIPSGSVVSISGLTIQNAGNSGIYNEGILTVSNTTLTGNSGSDRRSLVGRFGGGINNAGNLTVIGSTFSNNMANYGGGIWNGDGGALSIIDCVFENNTASDNGGGIYTEEDLSIENSTFSGNSARLTGGGIYNESSNLTISGSTFSENTTEYQGGGAIRNYGGTTTISDSTISGNSAGGISTRRGSLNIHNTMVSNNNGSAVENEGGDLTIVDSTFVGNSAGDGAGILNRTGTVTITRSTFSNNSATRYGGAISSSDESAMTISDSSFIGNSAGSESGAINNYQSALFIINSTFTENSTDYGGAISTGRRNTTIVHSTIYGNSARIRGGGIFVGANGAINLSNSIIAGNNAAEGPDIYGEVNSLSGNLIGNSQGALGLWASDLLQGDLLLSPPADNGGPTPTMALQIGSPAIDAIPAEDCVWDDDGDPNTPAVQLLADQRGALRTGPCDAGAFEFGIAP